MHMRRSLATLLCFAVCSTILLLPGTASAAIHANWHLDRGIRMQAVATAADGSVYVVGDRRTSITAAAFLMKVSPAGDKIWSRSWLPNPQASTNGVGVAILPGGNIAWTGNVQQQCEGNGWFVQVNRPNGSLVRRYVTPGWKCSIAETVTDIAATPGRIIVTGFKHGCCADFYEDGWVEALDATAYPRWRTNVEPPAPTPHSFFDRATGISVGSSGNLFAAGWGATRAMLHETSPIRGTAVIWKLMPNGDVVFSHRIGAAPMPSIEAPVAIAVRGQAVMVTAGIRGADVGWHRPPTDGWLGRFTVDGSLVWSRRWDRKDPGSAEPMSVAIDASGAAWVVGTRRTVSNRGLASFVRRYRSGGTLLDKATFQGGARYLHGTGVTTRAAGAYVTSWFGNNNSKGGRLSRLAT
jgi:hypothetical protein